MKDVSNQTVSFPEFVHFNDIVTTNALLSVDYIYDAASEDKDMREEIGNIK